LLRWDNLTGLLENGSFVLITSDNTAEPVTVYIFSSYEGGKVKMTHWKKLTNPNYLGSYAFQPGEEKAVTIAAVGQEEVTNPAEPEKKENCIVAHFMQPEKPLILNKTNCRAIERLAGTPDIEKWPGVGIILCVQRVPAFGELVEAVRVRPVKPFICADCGGVISGYGGKGHAEIREHTRKTYGRQLCAECATKAKASAGKAPEKENAQAAAAAALDHENGPEAEAVPDQDGGPAAGTRRRRRAEA